MYVKILKLKQINTIFPPFVAVTREIWKSISIHEILIFFHHKLM